MNRNILLVIIGAVVLCFAALDNKFPILTPDTGSYINAGFTRNIPFDKHVLYGLFIRQTSWGISLWLVIFCQALILSLMLFYYFRYFSLNLHYIIFYLACLFFIAFCMSASLTASKIAPDVFAGIAILGMGLILFAKNIAKRDFRIILTITIISTGMDVAYLVTLALLVGIYGVWQLVKRKGRVQYSISLNKKKVFNAGLIVVSSWLLISMLHFLPGTGSGNIISRDEFQGKTAKKALIDLCLQIPNVRTAKYAQPQERSETYKSIYKWYNSSVRESYLSRQMAGWLNFWYLNYAQVISSICCCIFFILVFFNKVATRQPALFLYAFIAVIAYAFAVSFLYGSKNDMQSGIVWILTVPVFIYLSEAGFKTPQYEG